MKNKKCKHYSTWIIGYANYEWCYQCGALRRMHPYKTENAVLNISQWTKPTGVDGKNPWPMKIIKRNEKRILGDV